MRSTSLGRFVGYNHCGGSLRPPSLRLVRYVAHSLSLLFPSRTLSIFSLSSFLRHLAQGSSLPSFLRQCHSSNSFSLFLTVLHLIYFVPQTPALSLSVPAGLSSRGQRAEISDQFFKPRVPRLYTPRARRGRKSSKERRCTVGRTARGWEEQ